MVMDHETGKPRGFGFVTFEDVRDAQDAVSDARGKVGLAFWGVPPPIAPFLFALLHCTPHLQCSRRSWMGTPSG